MKLQQMSRTAQRTFVSYRCATADRRGDSHYEVLIHGPKGVVEKALGELDLTFDIDPDATREEMEERALKIMEPYHRQLAALPFDPARPAAPPGKKLSAAKPSHTITVSLRPTAPHGTFWFFDSVVPLPLPGMTMLQVVFPLCFNGGAMSIPVIGNPDVFIRLNSATAPFVGGSTNTGLAIDTTTFGLPFWAHARPFYQFLHGAPVATRITCWGLSLLPAV